MDFTLCYPRVTLVGDRLLSTINEMLKCMKISTIEDEPVLLEKLRLILDIEKGFQVVGAFTSAEEAMSH